ncbi:MAG: alpha/beta hydrolase [Bacteroidetes bacterium]|nr:alpha/beta hydrolase [Bacteroidota bacterium]MBS1929724.1 alpha/beta hydrolase [Bacteroidota bacterium]
MNKVYFISGLGADKRVFNFLDLSFCEPVFIEWIAPFKHETLAEYAIRLRSLIPESAPEIVGISLGGMLVTEMAKADNNITGVIISSNKTKKEFPKYLRILKLIPVYNWFPPKITKKMLLNLSWVLGVKGKNKKKLLRQIILDSNIDFIKWALAAIVRWDNEIAPKNIIHIHGTSDKLLPYRLVKANYTIKGGSHVMVMNKSDEVSKLLKTLLK